MPSPSSQAPFNRENLATFRQLRIVLLIVREQTEPRKMPRSLHLLATLAGYAGDEEAGTATETG
jgi:hypothetical protein